MSTLITGASGFIGQNLAEYLASSDDNVVLFDRQGPPDPILEYLKSMRGTVHLVIGDILDLELLKSVLQNYSVERVIHAAAITPNEDRERKEFLKISNVNIMGTLTVIRASLDCQIDRMLFVSSAGVYGSVANTAWLDENSTIPVPDDIYMVTKFAAEQIGLRLYEAQELDFISARIGAAFGPWERDTGVRDTFSPFLQIMLLARQGIPAVLPRPGRKDWTYSRDIARALTMILEKRAPSYRVYNIGIGKEWTVADWCEKLKGRIPGFSYRIDDSLCASNVNLHGEIDRPPLNIERLSTDIGFKSQFTVEGALDDYLNWMDSSWGRSLYI